MGGDGCPLAGRKGRGRRGNLGRGEMLRTSGMQGKGAAEVGVTGRRAGDGGSWRSAGVSRGRQEGG